MLNIPEEIENLLCLIDNTTDDSLIPYGYKLLSSMLNRHGMRWEYFV